MKAATKKRMIDFILTLVLLLIVLGWAAGAVRSHTAVTGWSYPTECCGYGDCDIAQEVKYLDGGAMSVTTKFGTEVYPLSFPRRSSPDGLIHACHKNGNKYCLFVPAGV